MCGAKHSRECIQCFITIQLRLGLIEPTNRVQIECNCSLWTMQHFHHSQIAQIILLQIIIMMRSSDHDAQNDQQFDETYNTEA